VVDGIGTVRCVYLLVWPTLEPLRPVCRADLVRLYTVIGLSRIRYVAYAMGGYQ